MQKKSVVVDTTEKIDVFVKKESGQVVITYLDVKIVQCLSNGIIRRNIPSAIGIKCSYRTIEAKIDRLRKQFDCTTSSHLVATFFRKGLIS